MWWAIPGMALRVGAMLRRIGKYFNLPLLVQSVPRRITKDSSTVEGDMEQEKELELPSCEFLSCGLTWRVDKLIPSTVEVISPTVDEVMRWLKERCCPPEEEFAVEMALREALANAVVHGNRENPHKRVRICCACDAGRGILIVVKDQGEGFDLSKVLSRLRREQVHWEHGRGIYLLNSLMDEVQFRRGGREIFMRKDFHPVRSKTQL